jgi:signal transduction histidine kinase
LERRHQEEDPSPASGGHFLSGRIRTAALAVAFWTALGFLFAANARLRMPRATWSSALQGVMPQCYAWALMTPVIFAVDRRLLGGMAPRWRVLSHVPFAMLLTPIPVSIDYVVQKARHAPWLAGSLWENFVQQFMSAATIYSIIVGVSMAGSYRSEARRREREAAQLGLHAAQLQSQLTEARLHALQSQLNPHFLFNTLNTISALTETDPKMARQMMACLGKLLRASLDHAGRREVGMEDELAFLEDYLMIERLRFEDRLTVDVHVEDDTRAALVPSFILQPLVENAIRHGAGVLRRKSHIQVSVSQSGGRLMICVEDDGAGLPEGWRFEDHAGVGLSNIARRLQELYGSGQMFAVSPRSEGGVRAAMALPLHWQETAPAATLDAEAP